MERMTITEALEEITLAQKKIESKTEAIAKYVARPDDKRDPLEKNGGSAKFVAEERQAINDLGMRILNIRKAIAQKNYETMLTVENKTMTVGEWIIWKRDVYGLFNRLFANINAAINVERRGNPALMAQRAKKNADPDVVIPDVTVAVDEKEFQQDQENLATTYQRLDGKLSMINATTVVEF